MLDGGAIEAVAELEVVPGVGSRNGFIKQLAEVGLTVHEERMYREPGVSTRTAGRLTAALDNHLSGAGTGASAPAPTSPTIVAALPAQNAAAEPKNGDPAVEPAAVRPNQPSTIAPNSPLPKDETRSPSRATRSGPRRMPGDYATDCNVRPDQAARTFFNYGKTATNTY